MKHHLSETREHNTEIHNIVLSSQSVCLMDTFECSTQLTLHTDLLY